MTAKSLSLGLLPVTAVALIAAWPESTPLTEPSRSPSIHSRNVQPTSALGASPSQSVSASHTRPSSAVRTLQLDHRASAQSRKNFRRLRRRVARQAAALDDRLHLTANQEREARHILASSSPLLSSDMRVAGQLAAPLSPVQTQQAIFDLLDTEQQETLIDDELDELTWWDDLVTELESELDETTTAELAAPPVREKPAEAEAQPTFNLFDSLPGTNQPEN